MPRPRRADGLLAATLIAGALVAGAVNGSDEAGSRSAVELRPAHPGLLAHSDAAAVASSRRP